MPFSITPSHIIEYLFCPRFTYFEYVLEIPQYEERNFKVMKGRNVHELKAVQNIEYLRKKLGVVKKLTNQYLTNDLIRGEIDEILILEDGIAAPLDYKFAEYKEKIFDTYKTQLYCYAWLIESNFNLTVNQGFIVYTRSSNKLVKINIHPADIEKVIKVADEIKLIIEKNIFPKPTKFKKKCLTCTYKNICIQ